MKENVIKAVLDEVNAKILVMTMRNPVTVQDIVSELEISPATCYRKIKELVDEGLIVEVNKVLVEGQKRRSAYISTIENIKIEVSKEGINVGFKEKQKIVEILDLIKKVLRD